MNIKTILYLFGCLIFLKGSIATCEEPNILNIGSIASLTGYGSFAGNAELQGATLAVEEINKSGGINSMQIKLHSEDNQSDQKQTLTAFRKLKSVNNVFATIGPNWTEFASPLASVADSEKIIMITPTGYNRELLENKSYVYSLQFPAETAIKPFADYLNRRNFEEIIIFVAQNAFYEMLTDALITSLPNQTILSKESIAADSLDFKSSLNKIRGKKNKNIGIIVFLLENGPAATFVKQARGIGIKSDNLMLGPIVKYDDILKNDQKLTNGLIHFDYIYEIPVNFKIKFNKRFGVDPTFGSAQSYDAVNLLKDEINKCGIEKEKLIKCLDKTNSSGISGPIMFNDKRERIITQPVIQVFKIEHNQSVKIN